MKKQDTQEPTATQPTFSATQKSEKDTSTLPPVFRGKAIAWIVLLASLLVTFFAWYLARSAVLQSANERFVFRSQTIEMALLDRLHTCTFMLQSGVSLFSGSEQVTREEWRAYVSSLQIEKHYQGVQGLGFAKRVIAAEKSTHIRQVRDEGLPEYEIRPDGKRPEYTPIVYVEPFDRRNQRAIGYDMYSEATRREAMVMARDTGLPALSGKMPLRQETEKDIQASFLMYLPVYRNGEVPETPDLRREALTGYVYSPFRMNDLMLGLLIDKREYVELQVFDGDEPLKEALLYPGGNMASLISHSGHAHFATYQSILEYAGRRWLLVFQSSPYFEETIDTDQVNSILLLGIITSLLLFYLLQSLTRSHKQALSLANMTVDLEKANFALKREIEERKQAAQNLEESKLRFKTVFNAAIDGILVADAQTRKFVMGNSAICDMLGYQLEELIRLGIQDIHPAATFPEVLQQVERQAKGEIRLAPDLPVQRKDGSVFYADVNTTTMVLAGRPVMVGVFHDVTERKQGEEKIRQLNDELEDRVQARTQQLVESQALLSTVFDSVQDGIVLVDIETRQFRMSNISFQRMLGYSADEILELGVENIHPREEMDNVEQQLERLVKQENSYAPNILVKRKDGSTFYADINTSVMMVKETSLLLAVFRDITERRKAEEHQRQALLYARSLIEADMDPLVTINMAGRIMDVNEAAIQMTGVPRELMIDSDFSVYFTEPDRALAGYQEAFAKGSVRDYPLTMKHASGALTEVLYNASVYRNEKGEMAGVLAVARDISERLRAELAEEEARRDGLTELYNHRTFHILLKDEIFRTQRFNHQLSLLMLDVDYFKQVNDTYGHQAGDTILKSISELLVKQARAIDRVCRYGGEEITLILPETVARLAMKIAERLRASVEHQSFDIGDGKTINISVSIGVATYPQQANSPEALIKAADLALYAAKQAGRNRVCCYQPEMGA